MFPISYSRIINEYVFPSYSFLVQVESFFSSGHEKPFPHDFFAGVVGQFEIMDTGVDAWVGAVAGVYFAHDCQAGKEIAQSA